MKLKECIKKKPLDEVETLFTEFEVFDFQPSFSHNKLQQIL